jgi:hypothetical protein
MIGSTAVLLAAVHPADAKANPAAWNVERNEYGCDSAYRRFDTHEAWIYRHDESRELPSYRSKALQTYPYSIRLRWTRDVADNLPPFSNINPIGGLRQDQVIRFGASDIPPLGIEATQVFGKPDSLGNMSLHPQIVFYGDSRSIDWFGVQPRTIDYFFRNGRVAARFVVTDIASGFERLQSCRPVAAPPNRAASPRTEPALLVDAVEFLDVEKVQNRRRLKAFEAVIGVNAKGLMTSCTVQQSTGMADVDAQICARMQDQAQFVAATDAQGKHIDAIFILRGATLLEDQ